MTEQAQAETKANIFAINESQLNDLGSFADELPTKYGYGIVQFIQTVSQQLIAGPRHDELKAEQLKAAQDAASGNTETEPTDAPVVDEEKPKKKTRRTKKQIAADKEAEAQAELDANQAGEAVSDAEDDEEDLEQEEY